MSKKPETKAVDTRSLEYRDDKSHKFWTIELKGMTHTVHFGRIGTAGQKNAKKFESTEEAKKSFDNLIRQKLKKGYMEVSGSESTMEAPASRDPLTLFRSHRVNEKCDAVAVAFSHDGSLIAIAYRSFGSHPFANKVLVWDLHNWRKVNLIRGCTDYVDDVAFSPDGKRLICVGGAKKRFMGGEFQIWCTRTWKSLSIIEGEGIASLRTVAVSPDGKLLATGSAISGSGKKLQLWDAPKGKCLRTFGQLNDDVQGLAFSPDCKALAAGVAGDRTASVWTVPGGRKLWQKRVHTDAEACKLSVVFSPDGKLVGSCADKNVALSNAANGKSHAILKGHEDRVTAIAFSQDGSMLVSAGWQGIRFWDTATGNPLGFQSIPNLNLVSLAIAPNGNELIGVHTINGELTIQQYQMGETTPAPAVMKTPKATEVQHSKTETILIAAVIAKPDDNAPRLKYADWLDKQSDPRGEFIRMQCERSELEQTSKLTTKQQSWRTRSIKREQQLLRKHFTAWTAPLSELQITPDQVEFRRGFLHRLQLRAIDITDDSLKLLRHVPELEHLDLQGTAVTNDGMRHLQAVTNLSSLEVSETSVTVAALKHLRSLKRLIRVYNYEWGNRKIAEVESFKKLRNDRFRKLPPDKRRAEAIRALQIIVDWMSPDENGEYPRISFSQSWATDADLVYLTVFPETRSLYFFECDAVTEEGLKFLNGAEELRELEICESGVRSVEPLQHVKNLQTLELSDLRDFDEQSLRFLKPLNHLKKLIIRFFDNLTDAALPHIAALNTLENLELYEVSAITDKALENLLQLKNLKTLQLDYMDDRKELVQRILRG